MDMASLSSCKYEQGMVWWCQSVRITCANNDASKWLGSHSSFGSIFEGNFHAISYSKRTFFDLNMKNRTKITASKKCDEFPQRDQYYRQAYNMAQWITKYQVDWMNIQKVVKWDFDTLHWPRTKYNIQFDNELRWIIHTRALHYQSYIRNALRLIRALWDIKFSLDPNISNKWRWVSSMALMQSYLWNK